MPFTLAALTIFTLFNGLYQTVPIYIATLVLYLVVCGSGVFTALQLSAMKREEARLEALRAADQAKSGQPVRTVVPRASVYLWILHLFICA